jgi:hypothetical protein
MRLTRTKWTWEFSCRAAASKKPFAVGDCQISGVAIEGSLTFKPRFSWSALEFCQAMLASAGFVQASMINCQIWQEGLISQRRKFFQAESHTACSEDCKATVRTRRSLLGMLKTNQLDQTGRQAILISCLRIIVLQCHFKFIPLQTGSSTFIFAFRA